MTPYKRNKPMLLPIGKDAEEEREGTCQTSSLRLFEPYRNSLATLYSSRAIDFTYTNHRIGQYT